MDLRSMLAPLRHRRGVRLEVRQVLASLPVPADRVPYETYGFNTVRVLLIGSGHAVGYGVEHRAHALDGQLAERLARHLDRGVIVHNYARPGVRISTQLLRGAAEFGFGLENLVVWCPSHLEIADRIWFKRWERDLDLLLKSSGVARVVVLELALPQGGGAMAVRATALIRWLNRGIRRAAAGHANVAVVTPPPIVLDATGMPVIDRATYALLGERVAEVAAALLAADRSRRSVP